MQEQDQGPQDSSPRQNSPSSTTKPKPSSARTSPEPSAPGIFDRQGIKAFQILLEKSAGDPEWFALDSGLVWTWDKADRANPYKPLPRHKLYMRYLFRGLHRYRTHLIPKSRDMIATLSCCTYYAWLAMFHTGTEIVFVSDKSDKSEYNLGNVWFSYQSLPGEVRAMIPAKMRKGNSGHPRRIQFLPRDPLWPGDRSFMGSDLYALAQGEDKIQAFHPSAIYIDQIETMVRPRETLNAIFPIAKPPVKVTISGTASPGVWEELVFDRNEQVMVMQRAA